MQFGRRMRAARAAAARDRDQGMVAVSTASTWPELKLETSTVLLGAAVMSLGTGQPGYGRRARDGRPARRRR